ncbi:dicarboxylate/amino acid:cation symporter [Sediminitomix flava]|uniref:Na+/H+-dicarboxylate symporter n=1 Tax=Sediminitomix flava TaxID=379075 RepID=A0A315ZH13_SEDFL|nr:dicarboxylate/amino acid:cation symporter [Sediminitomix flava]PWJ44420.1 Na+/H+-dicarboxylate symporter [Sediminitomix flava]
MAKLKGIKLGLLPKLIIAIFIGIGLGNLDYFWIIRLLATFNEIFGNYLGFMIPLIIIGFIVPGIGDLGSGAGKLLALTAGLAYLSTITAGAIAYGVNSVVLPNLLETGSFSLESFSTSEGGITPYFTVEMPPLMGVMSALLLAFTLGLGITIQKGNALKNIANEFQLIIEKIITLIIIPLLPFHIAGIFAQMTYTGQSTLVLSVFIKVFLVIFALHFIMLSIQYTIAGILSKQSPLKLLKTMLPAYFTAIGTQSSAATIPVTLRQVIKNNVREDIADFTVPLCATIHLSGSTITLTSCAMAIMMLNGMPTEFGAIFGFIMMLGVTMIAAPGVPGGAVVAALGLLETMLGFPPTLTSLMIALYMAQDSFGTACNVTGDGAISIMVDQLSGTKK